jgi:tRNA nucleotidyltransferase/poly(A) polymerase
MGCTGPRASGRCGTNAGGSASRGGEEPTSRGICRDLGSAGAASPEIGCIRHFKSAVLHSNSPQFDPPSRLAQRIIDFVRGRAKEAWLVGGSVRDLLLNRATNDLDLAVASGAIFLARAVADEFGGHFFVLDEGRDVARAVVPDASGQRLLVDIARLRAPRLESDLGLRDFTVNAMALPAGSAYPSEVVDPLGGREDLRRGVIRVASEAAFSDDPLRLLRAVRQAAELGFRIDHATYHLIRRDAALVNRVAAERVRDELSRILALPGAWQSLRVLRDTGLLFQVLPEAAALGGIVQSPPHYQDVFDHTCSVLAHLEGLFNLICDRGPSEGTARSGDDVFPILDDHSWMEVGAILRSHASGLRSLLGAPVSAMHNRRACLFWAASAHDWGKPGTCTVDESGVIHFLGHDDLGARLVESRLRELRMASSDVDQVRRLVGLHMRPGYLSHDYPPSHRAVYRFFHDAAGAGPDCILLSLADHAAIQAGHRRNEAWERRLKTGKLLLDVYFLERTARVEPVALLDGTQVMSILGLPPGPRIGQLLEGLREAQAVGEVRDYDGAIAWLMQQNDEGGN